MKESELVKHLPMLPHTRTGKRIKGKQLDKLIEAIRNGFKEKAMKCKFCEKELHQGVPGFPKDWSIMCSDCIKKLAHIINILRTADKEYNPEKLKELVKDLMD